MKNTRTKKQIACDGVKTSWHSDTFTEILYQQVTTQFYMDGVIPGKAVSEQKVAKPVKTREKVVQEKQKEVIPGYSLVGVMDGIRLPWKKKYSTA